MCKYCGSRDFTSLNNSVNYSGAEISLNNQGILRVRTFQVNPKYEIIDSQDIINIKFCPICGRHFD